jgi:hypothetical protein
MILLSFLHEINLYFDFVCVNEFNINISQRLKCDNTKEMNKTFFKSRRKIRFHVFR